MLYPDKLAEQLITVFKNSISIGLQGALENHLKFNGEVEANQVNTFLDSFETICYPSLAKGLAYAIDSYIKNADIYGHIKIDSNTILIAPGEIKTEGDKHAQANVNVVSNTYDTHIPIESPSPRTNGILYNTFGIK